ncbi:MAG: ROK family protein [Kiritimatiellia bacterium]
MIHRVGIDLGGTKIEGVVLDPRGEVLVRRRVPTVQEDGYEAILDCIAVLYRGVVEEAGNPDHTLGIGTPGAVSPRTGLLKNSNTLCLNGKPIHRDLESRVEHALRLENDANCFALAEAIQGAGRGARMVFGVIMGTGCGGGLVIDGQVWTGAQAIGGEWGHMSIDPAGAPCYCGRRGCVETFISGSGLQRQWRERHGQARSLPDIVAGHRSGEPEACAFMADFFEHFGRALGNLINVLDPDVVVLGGGVSNIDELYTEGAAGVGRHIFSDSMETPIVRHQLGDSAGVIGAALLGLA